MSCRISWNEARLKLIEKAVKYFKVVEDIFESYFFNTFAHA
jgi:hypothetical protein